MPGLSRGMWDLVPCPGIEPRPPALGAWSLSPWTTREVPYLTVVIKTSLAGRYPQHPTKCWSYCNLTAPTPVLLPGESHGRRSLVGCSPGVTKSRTRLSGFTFTFHFMHWRRKWQPTPVFLPGESQGPRSLVGCCLWGHTESDTTEAT